MSTAVHQPWWSDYTLTVMMISTHADMDHSSVQCQRERQASVLDWNPHKDFSGTLTRQLLSAVFIITPCSCGLAPPECDACMCQPATCVRRPRQTVFGDPVLAEELFRIFHSVNDPACLTELLRMFSTAAMAMTPAVPLEAFPSAAGSLVSSNATKESAEETLVVSVDSAPIPAKQSEPLPRDGVSPPRVAPFVAASGAPLTAEPKQPGQAGKTTPTTSAARPHASLDAAEEQRSGSIEEGAEPSVRPFAGLLATETLERLAFFLDSSLEEKLLSRVSFGVEDEAFNCLQGSLMTDRSPALRPPLARTSFLVKGRSGNAYHAFDMDTVLCSR